MTERNIWGNLGFSDIKQETAYNLLLPQSDKLSVATQGELEMSVEVVNSYLDTDPPEPVALYILYVVAPNLGNFRRKVLTVVEGRTGRFPVRIYSAIDDTREEDITENNFLDKIAEILERPLVSNSIETLYQQSRAYSKRLQVSGNV